MTCRPESTRNVFFKLYSIVHFNSAANWNYFGESVILYKEFVILSVAILLYTYFLPYDHHAFVFIESLNENAFYFKKPYDNPI